MPAREKQATARQEVDPLGLPIRGEHQSRASAATETADMSKSTILLVEDEAGLRIMMHKMIQALGYRAFAAANGPEALQIWQDRPGQIDLLLTDMVMEGMSGVQLAQKLRSQVPKLKVVYTSGFSVDFLGEDCEPLIEGENFVQKPYCRQTLASTIRYALESTDSFE